jgi:hypothetical protein
MGKRTAESLFEEGVCERDKSLIVSVIHLPSNTVVKKSGQEVRKVRELVYRELLEKIKDDKHVWYSIRKGRIEDVGLSSQWRLVRGKEKLDPTFIDGLVFKLKFFETAMHAFTWNEKKCFSAAYDKDEAITVIFDELVKRDFRLW